MSDTLESARTGKALAERIVSIAGRFAQLPDTAPPGTFHFIHGQDDAVIPNRHALEAQERIARLGGNATVDLLLYAGHQIASAMANALIERLRAPEIDARPSSAPPA